MYLHLIISSLTHTVTLYLILKASQKQGLFNLTVIANLY